MRKGRITIPGSPGHGRFAITLGPPPIVVVPGTPIVLSFAGDSITFGGHGFGTPATQVPALLSTALGGRTVTAGFNAGHNGYAISYYMDSSQDSLRHADTAAMVAAGTTHTQIMFGANDQRYDILTTKAAYLAGLTAYMAELTAAGIISILHFPAYVQPGSFSNAFTRAGATLMESYIPGMRALTNGTTRLLGDVSSYANFRDHPEFTWTGSTSDSGLFPTFGTTGGDADGVHELAVGWVAGLVSALNTYTAIVSPINVDGTMNVSAWRAYFDDWSFKAWSDRLGPKSTILDSALPNLFTAPILFGITGSDGSNLLYDRLGEGVAPYYTDGSLATPDRDLRLMTSAPQVNPNTWGPTHAAMSPHNGNWRFGPPTGPFARQHQVAGSASADQWVDTIDNPFGNAHWYLRHSNDYWGEQMSGDYDSDFSSLLFIAQNAVRNSGIEAAQVSANYNLQKAYMPKRNIGAGPYNATSGTNFQLYKTVFSRGDNYGCPNFPASTLLGKPTANPICIDRGWINAGESLIIDRDGVMTCQPGPTTRDGSQYPLPAYKFPTGERPIKICVSSMSEFAAVIVQDLNRNVCKVRVIALNGGALGQPSFGSHSPIYTGLANNGGYLQFVDCGSFDIGLKFAESIEMGCDSMLATPDVLFGGNYLATQSTRDRIQTELGERNEFCMWARHGFIAVSSKRENAVEAWDVSAFIESVYQGYMVHDQTAWNANFAAMQAGTFPLPLSSGTMPTLIKRWTIQKPTCLLASTWLVNDPSGSGGNDHDKLMVGSESGLVTVINTSPIMDRIPLRQFKGSPFDVFGSFQVGSVGSNITEMCWSKAAQDISYTRVAATGVMPVGDNPNEYLNSLHVCCRADRAIYSVCTRYNSGTSTELGVIYRTVQDQRIKDPVGVSLATRAMIFQIADFDGMQIHNIQVGSSSNQAVWDASRSVNVYDGATFYPNPSDHSVEIGYSGSLKLAGCPVSSTANNIN